MIFHPWHLISPGNNAPKSVNSIIEISKGSRAKYELDKATGLLRLDRVLMTDLTYPVHYGFIPQTYCEDADPLDILVVCSEPLIPLTIVEATVIGAMRMIDGGQLDDKILAIATHDRRLSHITNMATFPQELLSSIRHFFENYKKEERKSVEIKAFLEQPDAHQVIKDSIALYQEEITRR